VKGKLDDKLYAEGSTGQPKVNPLVAELRSIEDQIETLERRVFGDQVATPTGAASDPAALLEAANQRFAELARRAPRGRPRPTRASSSSRAASPPRPSTFRPPRWMSPQA
jgi:hypothetical protein